jgi:hypothetical protein
MPDTKNLFGAFVLKPNHDVTEDQVREAIIETLKGLGKIEHLYVGDDQPPPQPPPPKP